MKILIPLHGFISWNGGVDLIRLVATGLRASQAEHRFELMFAWPRDDSVQTDAVKALRAMGREICGGDRVIECEYSARGINHAAVESNAQVIWVLSAGSSSMISNGDRSWLIGIAHAASRARTAGMA